jgi:hypothetical protein
MSIGKQRGNNVHFGTTVTAMQYFLVQSRANSVTSPTLGTRSPRGTLSEFTMMLIDKHFEERFGLPMLLLQEVLEESGVMEKIPQDDSSVKNAKPKYYPQTEDVIQAVVDDYKKRNLVNFMYGTGDGDASNNNL